MSGIACLKTWVLCYRVQANVSSSRSVQDPALGRMTTASVETINQVEREVTASRPD